MNDVMMSHDVIMGEMVEMVNMVQMVIKTDMTCVMLLYIYKKYFPLLKKNPFVLALFFFLHPSDLRLKIVKGIIDIRSCKI